MNRSITITIGSLVVVLVLAGGALAVPYGTYDVPFWTEAQGAGGVYENGSYGSTWRIGRTDQAGWLSIGPSFINPGPEYSAGDNEWQYLNQTVPPTLKDLWNRSGNARYKSTLELTTDGIWNQVPRPILIFEAPASGYYSFDGTAQWDWWKSGSGTEEHQSEVRFEFSTWEGHPWGPVLTYDTRTTLATYNTASFGIVQTSGTSGNVDLGSIPELQNIYLDAGDYLGINTGNRGVLYGSTPSLDVWDNSSMQLNVNPADPVNIYGATTLDPLSLSIVEVAGAPAGYTAYDFMATTTTALGAMELVLEANVATSIYQNSYVDDPDVGAATYDTYVTIGNPSGANAGETEITGPPVDIDPGSSFVFDDETLSIGWHPSTGVSRGPGTFQVARVVIKDTSIASWTLKGWQFDDQVAATISGDIVIPGDVNNDGFVGGGDLNTILGNWGMSGATRIQGDLTGEGDVGGADYNLVLSNWGSGTPPPEPDAVPEPATVALLLGGLLSLLRRRKA